MAVAAAALRTAAGRATGARSGTGVIAALLGLVHGLAELHRHLGKRLGLRLDRIDILAAGDAPQLLDRRLDRLTVAGRDLALVLADRLLGRVDQRLGVVLRFDQLTPLLVVGGVRLGVLHHAVDVGVVEAARSLDADLLLLAGSLVLGRDLDDAVGVDVERDLDLRYAP